VTLLKAAEYIKEHGWCQNSYSSGSGAVCIAGALNRIGYRSIASAQDISSTLHRHIGVDNYIAWQDTPGRTQAEVLKAMRGAALSAGAP
jgi:hypothetical protein